MRSLSRFVARLGKFLSGQRGDPRLHEEMEHYLALQTEENVRAGMTPGEARRQAVLKFGAAEAVRESYHAEGGFPLIEGLMHDLRYAMRMLWKSPGFTLVAVATLALGIGANAAIFTLVNAVMLRKLPVADPKSLVWLGDYNACCVGMGFAKDGDYAYFSTDSYEYLKKGLPEFESLAAMQAGFEYRPVTARRDGTGETPRSVMGEFVSGNYFTTFGLTTRDGRLLADRDDVAGAPLAAVMSFTTWKTQYNGDRSVVGSTFRINTLSVTVVGIAPEGFYGDRLTSAPPEFYLPIESMPTIANVTYVHGSDMQWLYLIGRVRPGVSLVQLQAKVSGLLRERLASLPHYSAKGDQARLKTVHVVPTPGGGGIQAMQEEYDKHLQLLMWASGLVLLIACANIANLLLVRGMGRKAEMNLRAALGAGRGRIVQQLVTESMLLAAMGGLAGLAVAYGGTRMLLALAFPGAHGVPIHASPSPEVLAFACGLTLVTGLLFGVAPAWMASQAEPVEALRSGSHATGGGATMLQRTLVVVQAALSLVLLVGAGLFAQSLNKLEHIDLKLDATNRYIVHMSPQTAGYATTQVGELYRQVEERFHAIPGVEKVGIGSYTPMEDDNNGWNVWVEGKPDPHANASVLRVNPEFFDSVGTHVVMGRGITVEDTPMSTSVAVVNEDFVKKFFKPGEDPMGQHFGGGERTAGDYEIVGVVENTAYSDPTWKDHPMYFVPLLTEPPSNKGPIDRDETLYSQAIVVATDRPIPGMEDVARKTLAEINPNLSVVGFQTFAAQISGMFTEQRMLAQLTMMFGGLALLLAALGLYGVTAYSVERRTAEIGIRMALGAPRPGVIGMVMRGALAQALIGLILGAPVAMLCLKYIKSQLYDITSVNLELMAGAIAVLLAATCVAGIIPARKAASIEPARTLKAE